MEAVATYPVILFVCVGERLRPVVGPLEMGRKHSSSLCDFTAVMQSGSLGIAALHTVAKRCFSSERASRSFAYRMYFL
jgi:hypothetical protein